MSTSSKGKIRNYAKGSWARALRCTQVQTYEKACDKRINEWSSVHKNEEIFVNYLREANGSVLWPTFIVKELIAITIPIV